VLVEERIFEDFSELAKSVSFQTAKMTRSTENSCSQPVRTAQRTQTIESTRLQGCLNAKVKTADREDFPYNRSDIRSSRPDALQQNIGFVVARPDAVEYKFEFEQN
jgi:hypothetical protein